MRPQNSHLVLVMVLLGLAVSPALGQAKKTMPPKPGAEYKPSAVDLAATNLILNGNFEEGEITPDAWQSIVKLVEVDPAYDAAQSAKEDAERAARLTANKTKRDAEENEGAEKKPEEKKCNDAARKAGWNGAAFRNGVAHSDGSPFERMTHGAAFGSSQRQLQIENRGS